MEQFKNINDLSDAELIELGKHLQQSIIKLVNSYNSNKRKDQVINKELFSFEFTDNGKREWLQATIGIITDPVLFHEENSLIHSWISTKVHLKIAERSYTCLIELIDILEKNNISFNVGEQIIKVVENNFILLTEQLNNVKEI